MTLENMYEKNEEGKRQAEDFSYERDQRIADFQGEFASLREVLKKSMT